MSSVRVRALKIAVFVLVVLYLPSTSLAADKPTVEKFEDWIRVCQTQAESQQQCYATQLIMTEQNGQRIQLLRSTVQRVNQKLFSLQLVLPLGIDLRPGVALKVDNFEQRGGSFATCSRAGCIVRMIMDSSFQKEIASGNRAKVYFKSIGIEQPQEITLSLKGITAATTGL